MRNIFAIIIISLIFSACDKAPSYKKRISNKIGMEFFYIKPGSFKMGPYINSFSQEVTLTKGFYIQKTEVTIKQWKKFINDTGYVTQAEKKGYAWSNHRNHYRYSSYIGKKIKKIYWKNPGYKINDEYPVTQISWIDSNRFIEWLNIKTGEGYRLPSEAEWEYACRAGTNTHFYNGDIAEGYSHFEHEENSYLNEIAWYGFNSNGHPHKVAMKVPNPWGLYDMLGNVNEYCIDYFKYYSAKKKIINPINLEKNSDPLNTENFIRRVVKGGAWNDIPSTSICASRGSISQVRSEDTYGFRVVKDTTEEDLQN